ncbi:MAG: hypothetical protein JWN40_4918 [Phycisphaerales bacterium]|nr:hypothetical protein [Phycisphaerales bacterium]
MVVRHMNVMGMKHLRSFGLFVSLVLSGTVVAEEPAQYIATNVTSKTIYHSPQSPGFTCWVGTWIMPDKSLMVTLTQATGPQKDRPRTDPKILAHFPGWPPDGNANYDMNGLDLRNVYLQSTNAGSTWKQVSADPFRSCMNHATGKAQVALPDGTIVRAVWGSYLPFDDASPKTGYLQRSRDNSKTWSPPETPLLDPKQFTTYPTRLRLLRDGRLILTGGIMRLPAGVLPEIVNRPPIEPLLMVSDNGGKTWSEPISVVGKHAKSWSGEEYDTAELPSGDLLCVFRTVDPTAKTMREFRWQALLKKDGKTWTSQNVAPAPLPHSGHPELLATREGLILHIATSGIDATADAGKTWRPLPGARPSAYYPRSLQDADGQIYIFSHIGGDDAYGAVDQSIRMDTLRLAINK